MENIIESYTKDNEMLLKNCHERAIQCCIDSWNQICPEHPLSNITKVAKQKQWRLFNSGIAIVVKSGNKGDVSKIVFEINNKLTAKAFRKHHESQLVVVNCRIWWNYDGYLVRGWIDHIVVDAVNNKVVDFPQITPSFPYWENPI
jgi:hypothetical protein